MLTKEELLDLDVPPLIKNVSLELYKEFSVNYLLPRKFIYHFSDGSKINVEFTECGIPNVELRPMQSVWVKEPMGKINELHICNVAGKTSNSSIRR